MHAVRHRSIKSNYSPITNIILLLCGKYFPKGIIYNKFQMMSRSVTWCLAEGY